MSNPTKSLSKNLDLIENYCRLESLKEAAYDQDLWQQKKITGGFLNIF